MHFCDTIITSAGDRTHEYSLCLVREMLTFNCQQSIQEWSFSMVKGRLSSLNNQIANWSDVQINEPLAKRSQLLNLVRKGYLKLNRFSVTNLNTWFGVPRPVCKWVSLAESLKRNQVNIYFFSREDGHLYLVAIL